LRRFCAMASPLMVKAATVAAVAPRNCRRSISFLPVCNVGPKRTSNSSDQTLGLAGERWA
jgi:hypothetical protein